MYNNPKVDIAFRKLFGSEENKNILKAFINSVLPENEQVEDLEIKNPYNLATYVKGKSSILDIKAIGKDGKLYDVEMQLGEQKFFGKRFKYYLDKVNIDQLVISEDYSKLKKVIGIALIDFNYFDDDRYKRGFALKDIDTNERCEQVDYVEMYYIEMKKFKKDLKELKNSLDRWITFFNKAVEFSMDKIPPELSGDENIKKAIEKLNVMYMNEDERQIYETEEKKRLDKNEEIRTAIEKGMEKGRIEVARNLLTFHDDETITKITNLSIEFVKQLRNGEL